MLKPDPHERFTIGDCLQSPVFETDRLRNRNSTPVPRGRRRQPLNVTDDRYDNQSEQRNSVLCDKMDTEVRQLDDCDTIVTSQQNNYAIRLNNESSSGTTFEITPLPLKSAAVPDVSTKPTKRDAPFITSTGEHVGDSKKSNGDSDSLKPGFAALDKFDTSRDVSNIDECSGEVEMVAVSNKYLKKSNTSKQPFHDLSENKSTVYETSFVLGPNATDKSVPATNAKNQTVNYVLSTQQTRLQDQDKKNNKVEFCKSAIYKINCVI